jgi:hypothetical protein
MFFVNLYQLLINKTNSSIENPVIKQFLRINIPQT